MNVALPLRAAAGFDGGKAGLAEGTLCGIVVLHGERDKCGLGDAQGNRPTAAVNERAHTHHFAAGLLHGGHGLARGAAGGDDILDDQRRFAGSEAESAAEQHDAFLAFGEERAETESSRYFVRDDDSAERRRSHYRRAQMAQFRRQRGTQLLGDPRVLQDQRALNVPIAVQARGKDEVPFKQGAVLTEDVENLVFANILSTRVRVPD